MSKEQRMFRDGSGPYRESFRRRMEGKSFGRRIEAGETCPKGNTEFTEENKIDKINFWR